MVGGGFDGYDGLGVKTYNQAKASSNEIKLSTYYTRLRKVREELLLQQPELQKIGPVSVSADTVR